MDTIKSIVKAVWETDNIITANGLPHPAQVLSKPAVGTGLLLIGIVCTAAFAGSAFAGPACDAVRRDQTNYGYTTILCDDTSDPNLVAGIVDMGGNQTKRIQWYFQGNKAMAMIDAGKYVGLDICWPFGNALKIRICHDAGLLHEPCESSNESLNPLNCRTAPDQAGCLQMIAICRQELASPAPKITIPPSVPLTFCHDAERDLGHPLLFCKDNAPSSPGGLAVYKDDNGRFQIVFGTGEGRYQGPSLCHQDYLDDPFTPCGRAKDAANGISEQDRAELTRQSIERIRQSSDELPPEYTGRWGLICNECTPPSILFEYDYDKTTLTIVTHQKDGQVIRNTWPLDIHKVADGYLVTEVYPVGWPKAGQKADVTRKIYLTHSSDGRDFLRNEREVYCRLAEGLPLRCEPSKSRQPSSPASR